MRLITAYGVRNVRSVYLALCEMESDFNDTPINFFTQTVGTYAGTSRQVAGKYINMLEKDGLISKVRMRDLPIRYIFS